MHREITDHHDGHGLAESIDIEADDADKSGASHKYRVYIDISGTDLAIQSGCTGQARDLVATIQYQQGPRNEPGSTPGVLDSCLLAILIDRLRGFQAGPYSSRENAIVLTKLEESLMWIKERAHARAKRGVLGKNVK